MSVPLPSLSAGRPTARNAGRGSARTSTGGATEAPSLRGAEVAPIGAPAPVAPTATVPSQRWLRFTQVVRKLSRLFVFIADIVLAFRPGRPGILPGGIEGP